MIPQEIVLQNRSGFTKIKVGSELQKRFPEYNKTEWRLGIGQYRNRTHYPSGGVIMKNTIWIEIKTTGYNSKRPFPFQISYILENEDEKIQRTLNIIKSESENQQFNIFIGDLDKFKQEDSPFIICYFSDNPEAFLKELFKRQKKDHFYHYFLKSFSVFNFIIGMDLSKRFSALFHCFDFYGWLDEWLINNKDGMKKLQNARKIYESFCNNNWKEYIKEIKDPKYGGKKLLKYIDCSKETLFNILESYKTKAIKADDMSEMFDIAGIIYDWANKEERERVEIFFEELDARHR
jgi:hypothetical protein